MPSIAVCFHKLGCIAVILQIKFTQPPFEEDVGERLWKWCQKTTCRVKQTLGSPSCDINAFSMIGSRSDYTWPHQKPGVNAPKMHWDQITTKPFWSLKTNVDLFPHLSAMSDEAFIICSPGSNEHYAIILLSNYFSALQLGISLFFPNTSSSKP